MAATNDTTILKINTELFKSVNNVKFLMIPPNKKFAP